MHNPNAANAPNVPKNHGYMCAKMWNGSSGNATWWNEKWLQQVNLFGLIVFYS